MKLKILLGYFGLKLLLLANWNEKQIDFILISAVGAPNTYIRADIQHFPTIA